MVDPEWRSIEALVSVVWPYLAAAARVLGFAAVAPWFGPGLDWRSRLVFALLLVAAVIPLAAAADRSSGGDPALAALLSELVTGGLLALPAALLLAGARQAGELVAAAAGFTTLAILEPEEGEPSTPLGRLHGLIALMAFLTLEGPLRLVAILAASFADPETHRLALDHALVERLCALMRWSIELGVAAAAPALVAITIASMAVGWIARGRSGTNLFFAPAVRIVAGLAFVALFLGVLATGFTSWWRVILGIDAA